MSSEEINIFWLMDVLHVNKLLKITSELISNEVSMKVS